LSENFGQELIDFGGTHDDEGSQMAFDKEVLGEGIE
jgi:hypothetical protein